MSASNGSPGLSAESLQIAIRRGDVQVGTLTPTEQPITLGRSERCEVVLDDPAVSRVHAVLSLQADEWLLIDQQSRNGVWVGGERVPRVALSKGVSAAVGPFLLVVEPVAQPSTADEQDALRSAATRDQTAPRDG